VAAYPRNESELSTLIRGKEVTPREQSRALHKYRNDILQCCTGDDDVVALHCVDLLV